MFGALTHGERAPSDEAWALIDAVRAYAFRHVPLLVEGDDTGVPLMAGPQEPSAMFLTETEGRVGV